MSRANPTVAELKLEIRRLNIRLDGEKHNNGLLRRRLAFRKCYILKTADQIDRLLSDIRATLSDENLGRLDLLLQQATTRQMKP